jgi:hypothetical protein
LFSTNDSLPFTAQYELQRIIFSSHVSSVNNIHCKASIVKHRLQIISSNSNTNIASHDFELPSISTITNVQKQGLKYNVQVALEVSSIENAIAVGFLSKLLVFQQSLSKELNKIMNYFAKLSEKRNAQKTVSDHFLVTLTTSAEH